MNVISAESTGTARRYLPALLADGAGILLLLTAFSPLAAEFGRRTARGGMILLVVYVVFAFGVNALKRLAVLPGAAGELLGRLDFTPHRWTRLLLALPVVAFFLAAQIDLNRAADSMIALMTRPETYGHEGEITLYYSFGPLFLWLMIGVLYLAAFALPTERRIEASSPAYGRVEFLGLLAINGMLVTTAAYLAALFARYGPHGGGARIWLALGALLALELLFDPARLRHALKNQSWWPVISFAALLLAAAAAVWQAL